MHFWVLCQGGPSSGEVLNSGWISAKELVVEGVSVQVCRSAEILWDGNQPWASEAWDRHLNSSGRFLKILWVSLVQWEAMFSFGNRNIYYSIYVFVYPQIDDYSVVPNVISN